VRIHISRPTNLWNTSPKWHVRKCSWYASFTAVRILFSRPILLYYKQKCKYIHMKASSLPNDAVSENPKVAGTDEDGRVLDGSAHLLSRVLVSQSDSIACCTLSVSARHPSTDVTGTYEGGRVLDGSAHLLSRVLVRRPLAPLGCERGRCGKTAQVHSSTCCCPSLGA
jgi:hypothetical protein